MCGVFGIAGHPESAKLTYLGLHGLQHRGQESAGIVVSSGAGGEDPVRFRSHLGAGLVADVFTPEAMRRLEGERAIGHVRYSTAGGNDVRNAQPIRVETRHGPLAVAHNGNLINAEELRVELEHEGAIFQARSDTEILVHLLTRARAPRIQDRLRDALAQVRGAYSLVVLHEGGMIGVRDPHGFRPLLLGRLGDAHILASETCALDLIGGELVREVEPGELLLIDRDGRVRSERLVHEPDAPPRACVFELVYFARPNSRLFELDVYSSRHALGRALALESPVDADLVIPVPDSGVPAALGFAEASGLPFRHGLLRSHYVGRTFIEPEQSIRHFGVKLKLSAVRSVLEGQRVVVVDDSIVRGTTSRKIVELVRAAGAREVHLRISSPPTTHPCYYGIDTPNRDELIASHHEVDAIARRVTADSLAYLSIEGLHQATGSTSGDARRLCDACFTGRYDAGIPHASPRLPVVD
jgi:amidophosphoribosyltransferase